MFKLLGKISSHYKNTWTINEIHAGFSNVRAGPMSLTR